MNASPIPGFTEPFSSLSHLLGAGVFAVLTVLLIRRGRGNRGRVMFLLVFGFFAVFQLSMSGVYHLLPPGTGGREVLRRLDHAAIYALIAATFTPIHGILFRGPKRWLPLLLVWTFAVTAISLTTVFFSSMPQSLRLVLYLSMGWLGLLSGWFLWQRFGENGIRFPIWGGCAYTIGAVAEYASLPNLVAGVIGPHEVFHVAVLAGIGLFWAMVHSFADGSWTDPQRKLFDDY